MYYIHIKIISWVTSKVPEKKYIVIQHFIDILEKNTIA